ncbi:MAG: alkaline phosphatase D family protein [bacterium]
MKRWCFILLINIYITSAVLAQMPGVTNAVVVGGVTSNTARFWLRISSEGIINIELSELPDFSQSIQGTNVLVSEETNFAGIVNVGGLKADTKYFLRVLVNGDNPVGRVQSFYTFPEEGAGANFSFGFGSCQQSGSVISPESGNVFREAVKHNLRLFLQLGDWTYPDTTDLFPLNTDYFAKNYNLIQKTYEAKFRTDYPMDSILCTMPVDYVYDDHDFMNNNCGSTTTGFYLPIKPNIFGDDFVVAEFPNPVGARENSIRGYKENFPSYQLVNESRGIYHKFTYGNAEFFMLDLRSQRSPNLSAFRKNELEDQWEFNPPEYHSILGREDAPGEGETQFDWFLNSLKNSTATWKFIVSSVTFNKSFRIAIDSALALQDTSVIIPGYDDELSPIAVAFEMSDKWAGFPDDIDAVLNTIETNDIKNVIVLSADLHTSAIDDGFNSGLPEILSAGLDIPNSRIVDYLDSLNIDIWNEGGQGINNNNFNDTFGKISVFASDSVRLELIDEYGTVYAQHMVLAENVSGVEYTNENIPFAFELYQNYPNPFNPETIIKYEIPAVETPYMASLHHVTLKIYDVLGREIATLVDEVQAAGIHHSTFSAQHYQLPSGVYFYRLNVGSFSETKKMVLLR